MSEVPFHLTRMGARFYEHTLPELVRQLERLNENLERIADSHGAGGEPLKENDDDTQGRTEENPPPRR